MKITIKTFVIFFLILFTNVIYCQEIVVEYKHTTNINKEKSNQYKLYLINNVTSLYYENFVKQEKKISSSSNHNQTTILINDERQPNNIYIDLSHKALYESTYLGKNNVVIKENLYPFKWNITNESKQIHQYICTKATTKFRGRNYEAWFTEEIPTQSGPWKMHGLPGLILELYDTEHLIVIQAQKITTNGLSKEQTDLINKIQKTKTIDFREYEVLFKKHAQELINQMATKMPEGFPPMKISENCEDCQNLEMYEDWEE